MHKIAAAFLFLFLLSSISTNAQENESIDKDQLQVGIEVQVYPTGIIPGIRIERFLDNNKSIHLRLAGQLIDHRDLGKKDDEYGYGGGASFGYRHFFSESNKGLSLGARADYWINRITWEDDNNGSTISDVTVVHVLQPTAMLEYAMQTSSMTITPSVSFGYEWNIITDGEETGEGPILLVGVTFGF